MIDIIFTTIIGMWALIGLIFFHYQEKHWFMYPEVAFIGGLIFFIGLLGILFYAVFNK